MDVKRAGYNAIIVEGKAEKPVYLLVTDAKVEIRDTTNLWGKTGMETQDMIAAETESKNIRTAAIGPAGENLVRFACVMNDLKDAAGLGGLGSAMGSKNLKAIAVFGRKPPKVADPAQMQHAIQAFSCHLSWLPSGRIWKSGALPLLTSTATGDVRERGSGFYMHCSDIHTLSAEGIL